MKIQCDIIETDLDGDRGTVPGVIAICSKCGYETQSFGTGEGSRLRCLVLLREECPEGENNFYTE